MTVSIGPGWSIGAGWNIGVGTSYSITLQSSDFSNGYPFNTVNGHDYPAVLGLNGTGGCIQNLSFISTDGLNLGNVAFDPWVLQISNSAVQTWFDNLVTAGVITSRTEPVPMTVTWGAGSSVPTSGAIVSGQTVGNYMFIAPVDTATTGWNTNPPNNDTTPALAGTFFFPATFTITPPVVNKGGWC